MNGNEEIYKKLEQIDSKVDDLLQWRAALDERCKAHQGQTSEVRRTVYGNPGGADGLQFDIKSLLNCKKRISRWRDFWLFFLRALAIGGIIGLMQLLISLVKGA